MSQVLPFHDLHEPDKPRPRYHTDDACPVARHIPREARRAGSGGVYLCEHCAALAMQDQQRESRGDEPIP